MNLLTPELFATLCFAFAVLHTFLVKIFLRLAKKYPEGSVGENFFHLLGEIEVVFGLWASVFLFYLAFNQGFTKAIEYIESRNFSEPIFVFVIMTICSTRPILSIARWGIEQSSKFLPLPRSLAFYFTTLTLGPLLGSFITEPAAMTITALILLHSFYKNEMSLKFKYATIAVLFVNISIGGTLTPYAAPPVLMVADTWNWDLKFMLTQFGWKACLAVILSTSLTTFWFRNELKKFSIQGSKNQKMPFWVSGIHLLFLCSVILAVHHSTVVIGIFLLFLGLATVTKEYHDELKLRESLLVGFFLGGLVLLGGPQRWWLEPLLSQLNSLTLYLGSIGLTAITDNAALTYLGSQVPGLSLESRYALVAGSVVGGGLTVIANAPNPAGFGILNSSFGTEGINPYLLFKNALIPTLIAAICFWL